MAAPMSMDNLRAVMAEQSAIATCIVLLAGVSPLIDQFERDLRGMGELSRIVDQYRKSGLEITPPCAGPIHAAACAFIDTYKEHVARLTDALAKVRGAA